MTACKFSKIYLSVLTAFILSLGAMFNPASAQMDNTQAATYNWRFPVGISGISAYKDVVDLHEDNLKLKSRDVDKHGHWPIGLSFQPHVEFNSGLRIGAGLGPATFVWFDEDNDDDDDDNFDDDDVHFYDVPLNLTVGYTFLPTSDISPYVRAGLVYHIAGGDYVEDIRPGVLGAVGIEFFRNRRVGCGIEFGFDTSKIEFERFTSRNGFIQTGTDRFEPYKFIITGYAVF